MKYCLLLFCFLAAALRPAAAQTGIGTVSPAGCAVLDLTSTSKGFLPPRMSWTQIQAIPFPQPGLTVFDIGINALRVYTARGWTVVGPRQQGLYDAPGNFAGSTQSGIGLIIPVSVKASRLNPANYYVAGYFTGLAVIGGSLLINANAGASSFFGKFDSTGSALWVKTLASNSTAYVNCFSMDLDAGDNIYLGGSYTGTIDFDAGAGLHNLTSLSTSNTDGFYAHYDAAGNYIWAKSVGSATVSDAVTHVSAASTFINIGGYGAGAFNGATFASGAPVVGHYDTSSGNLGSSGWVKQITDPTYIAIDDIKGVGNTLLVAGEFSGTMVIPGSPVNVVKTTAGIQAGFVFQLGATGFAIAALVVDPGSGGVADVRSITADAGNNYYYSGRYTDGTDFDPNAGAYTVPASPQGGGLYVVKLNSGYQFQWATSVTAATTTGGYNSAGALATDAGGNVTFTGTMNGPITLPNGNILAAFGDQDIFTGRYNTAGALQWMHSAGSSGTDAAFALDVSNSGKRVYTLNTIGSSPMIQYDGSKVSAQGFYLSRYEE